MRFTFRLHRTELLDDRTVGRWYDEVGIFKWWTLEDKDRNLEAGGVKVYGQTAIPRGTYQVVLAWSPKRKGLVPLLVGVPQFVGIEIHIGNRPEDTEGCILLGRKYDESSHQVIESELACSEFYPWLLGKIVDSRNDVWLTVD
jgi:hypothetical protein